MQRENKRLHEMDEHGVEIVYNYHNTVRTAWSNVSEDRGERSSLDQRYHVTVTAVLAERGEGNFSRQ